MVLVMIKKAHQYTLPVTLLFGALGVDAILAGGLLAAFTASRPSQFYSWATAYLVLVVGVLQIAFSISLYLLAKKPDSKTVALSFILYNLGNLCVVLGTALKNTWQNHTIIVDLGGLLLAVAMLVFMFAVRDAKKTWLRTIFYTLTAVIFISIPIGLLLAR